MSFYTDYCMCAASLCALLQFVMLFRCRSWCFDAMVDRAHHQKHAVGSYSCACLVSCVYVYLAPRLQWQKLLCLNPLLIKVVSWACWYLFSKYCYAINGQE